MRKLKEALKAYKALRDTERALEPLGVSIGDSKFAPLVYEYLAEEIAEYSPYYSVYRWHPIYAIIREETGYDCGWLHEIIFDILDDMEDIDEAAKEICSYGNDIGLGDLDDNTKKMVLQMEIVNENMMIHEKLLEKEEETNPVSEKAKFLATRIDSNRRFIEIDKDFLKKELGDGYEKVEWFLNRQAKIFSNALA